VHKRDGQTILSKATRIAKWLHSLLNLSDEQRVIVRELNEESSFPCTTTIVSIVGREDHFHHRMLGTVNQVSEKDLKNMAIDLMKQICANESKT